MGSWVSADWLMAWGGRRAHWDPSTGKGEGKPAEDWLGSGDADAEEGVLKVNSYRVLQGHCSC